MLEEEIVVLRRRLEDAPRRVRLLEERLLDIRNQLAQATSQNDKLPTALVETREQLALLRDEVEKLTAPPNPFGTVIGVNPEGTVDVLASGRKLRVSVEPTVEIKELERGQEVILNDAFNIVDVRTFEETGDIATIKELLGDDRLVVLVRGDEERVVTRGAPVHDEYMRTGDLVRVDSRTGIVLEKLARPEVEELILEEVPDITYDDIGGLESQIEIIQDAVELPYLHRNVSRPTASLPRRECFCTGHPAVARRLSRKPLRILWPGLLPRQQVQPIPAPISSTSRVRSFSTSTLVKQSGKFD